MNPSPQALVERRKRSLGRSYRLFYDEPLHPVRGAGVHLWDAEGRQYLDAYNNVVSVGHCHPAVVETLSRQAATLNTHTRYLDETVLDYAEALLATFPDGLDQVVFTCTGSEANDLAYRIARQCTGGEGVLVTANAYHGVTHACALFSPSLGTHVAPGSKTWTVPAPVTQGPEGRDAGEKLAADTRAAIEEMRAAGVVPAVMFIDTVFASDGIIVGEHGWLAPLGRVLREEHVLLVADEVQAGLARTGKAMWGFQRLGIEPDLVTIGKPMGNGHPLGATIARPDLMTGFGERQRYFNTFGGNPVSCAVGLAVLGVVHGEHLEENAREVGAYLHEGLVQATAGSAAVREVRGIGFYQGVDVVDPATGLPSGNVAAAIVNSMRHAGVLINSSGPSASVLKIRPPLPFGREHADCLLEALATALTGLS